jgi:hypothetical protein
MSDLDLSLIPDNLDHTWASEDVRDIRQFDMNVYHRDRFGENSAVQNVPMSVDDNHTATGGIAWTQPEVQGAPMFRANDHITCDPVRVGTPSGDTHRFAVQFTTDGNNTRFPTVGAAIEISTSEPKWKVYPVDSAKAHSFVSDRAPYGTSSDHGATVKLPGAIYRTDNDDDDVLHNKEASPKLF